MRKPWICEIDHPRGREIQRAVRQPAHQVAGAVHARAGERGEGIGQETFRGGCQGNAVAGASRRRRYGRGSPLSPAAAVAARHRARTARVLAMGRPMGGCPARLGRDNLQRGDSRGFRRAIGMDGCRPRCQRCAVSGQGNLPRRRASDCEPEIARIVQPGEQRGREQGIRHPAFLQLLQDIRAVHSTAMRRDTGWRRDQCGEDFRDRGVETDGGKLRHAALRGEREGVDEHGQQVDNPAMRERHALGLPGGSRRCR